MIESRLDAVMEMDHAVGESSLVQQLEPQADIVGQGWDCRLPRRRGEEQMTLVNQPELECLGSERGTAHGDVASRSRFQLLDRLGFELALDPVFAAGDPLSRLLEYTILSAACQIFAYSCPADGSSLPVGAVSQ